MLAHPSKGFDRSTEVQNVKLDALCDWIEACILFDDDQLSTTDVVDSLVDEGCYSDSDFAAARVSDAWAELQRRRDWIGGLSPFSFNHRRIQRAMDWQEVPAHSFCMVLSLAEWFNDWANSFGTNYNEQGTLFELLTKESLEMQFNGWNIYQTGWTRSRTVRLAEVVDEVASQLGVKKGDFALWDHPRAKEKGLDLLLYRPFDDKRVGIPVYLMQCASGRNWYEKLDTPKLSIWKDVINFKVPPARAFATPMAFLDDVFTQNCVIVEGMLLDRCRLLCARKYEANWVSDSLRNRIIDWATPRIDALPRVD